MNKKVVLSIVALLVLFATIVSASSHGTYDGYNIVKLKANGKELVVEDVPAINYKGRTMVPIGMLRQTGLDVVWNGDEYSVDVIVPDVNEINLSKEIMITYYELEDLGDSFSSTVSSFLTSFSGIQNGAEYDSNYSLSYNSLVYLINKYNSLVDDVELMTGNKLVDNQNVANDMNEILTVYYDAIEYLKVSLDYIANFQNTNTVIDGFFDNLDTSTKLYEESRFRSHLKIYEYADKIGKIDTKNTNKIEGKNSYDFDDAVNELGFSSGSVLTVDARDLALRLLEIRKTKSKSDYSVQDALNDLGISAGIPTLKTLEQAVKLIELK